MHEEPTPTDGTRDEDAQTLVISSEKVCFIIIKAKEYDAKDEITEPDPGSNPSDDKDAAVLEDHEDDPVVEELTSLIDSLSEDEQIDLVALAWLGRDDYSATDWLAVREEAARAQPEVEQAVVTKEQAPDEERQHVTEDAGAGPPTEAPELVVPADVKRAVRLVVGDE